MSMPRKGWGAFGDHDVDERRAVHDMLGFDAQLMFSFDYPHHEGTDDPLGRYERTMAEVSDADQDAVLAGNFEWVLGPRLADRGRPR